MECHYCGKVATEKVKVYEPDCNCSLEVDVCEECAIAIEDNLIQTRGE